MANKIYLDMANLSTCFAYKNRIADIYNKLYSITYKLHKTASSIGFINKALRNNVIPKFAQIKGQFVAGHEHIQAERKIMLSHHLNKHVCNLKIQINKHYDTDALLALSVCEIRYKLLKKRLSSSLYQDRVISFNTKNKKLKGHMLKNKSAEHIVNEIYVENKLPKLCSKLIFKRLLLKLTTENTFMINSNLYKQVDGCSMGGVLSVIFFDIQNREETS